MSKFAPKFHKRLLHLSCAFIRNESGATAIEYAIIASGIAGVVVGTVFALGNPVDGMYGQVLNAYNTHFSG